MKNSKCVFTARSGGELSLLGLVLVAACSSGAAPNPGSARDNTVVGASGGAAPSAATAGKTGSTPNQSSNTNGNTVLITPMSGGAPATAMTTQPPVVTVVPIEPITIDDCGANNSAGISDADAKKLRAGAGSAGGMRTLYPYDGTVFPRGMVAPDLMWEGPQAQAVYVHIKAKSFEYHGCLKPLAAGFVTLPQNVWDEAGKRTGGKGDLYTLELSTLGQGSLTGPAVSHFSIAQATVKGSIYYNSYTTKLTATQSGGVPSGAPGAGFGPAGGMVLKIPAGGRAEVFAQSSCNGCHSVSADGSRLLTQFLGNGAITYQLSSNGMAAPATAAGGRGAYGALYPDGSVYLSMSAAISVARTTMIAGPQSPPDAGLYDAMTGQAIANTGIPTGALMPMFSPDGKYLVFNDYALEQAHGLALMHYDTKTHTATDYKMLVTEPTGSIRPGWPFILPDNKAVVFVRTDGYDFSGNGAGVNGTVTPGTAPLSDLYIVDVASGTVTLLAKAMGFEKPEDAMTNKTYLPFGASELHAAYFPTVSPVAGGGYFWVFFDSARNYGNLGMQRQLWGAAIEISPDGSYKTDPSHPAFYLSGQEFGTGNHRAFAALDPCRQDGDTCTTGIDCCGGFCYVEGEAGKADQAGTCTPKMRECAQLDERCEHDADCCPPAPGQAANSCIAGFCALIQGPS